MRFSTIALASLVLVAAVAVEVEVKHHSKPPPSGHTSSATTTLVAGSKHPVVTVPQAHDACGDLSAAQVSHAIASGIARLPLINSTVAVDPGWRRADYSGCLWAAVDAKSQVVGVLELFEARFPTTSEAKSFYKEQTSNVTPLLKPSWRPVTSIGTQASFLAQSHGHGGGDLDVLQGNTAIAIDSVFHTKVRTEQQSLASLEVVAKGLLGHGAGQSKSKTSG